MGHLLVRGWILAALLLQTSVALTITSESTATPTPSAATSSQHHWSYISRSFPSRSPCSAVYSSSVPSSRVTPTPSAIVVPSSSGIPSSLTPLLRGSSTTSSRPAPSHSVASQPHWSYVSRPLPQRTQCSASSSGAIPASLAPASRPAPSNPVVISAPASVSTGAPQSSIASATQTVTAIESSTPQLTTSMVLSTRTATITACPSTVPNCPASSRTTFVTTETIVVSTTICPVTEAAGATQTAAIPPSVTGIAGAHGHGNGGSDFTTSTVFSTRTATITACPSSVTNCPLRSKTTYLTTETLVVSTTVCPVAGATGSGAAITQLASPSATGAVGGGIGDSELTTSTILTTGTTTITACPSSVTNCPLRSKTTYATTETLVLGTTVYPVSQLSITQTNTLPSATGAAGEVPAVTTSTILSTRVATVSACGDNSNCSGSSQGSYVTTETLVVGMATYTVSPAHTSIPAEGVDEVSAFTVAANSQPTGSAVTSQAVSTGSQSGSAGDITNSAGASLGTSSGTSSIAGSNAGSSSISGSGSGSSSGSSSGSGSGIEANTGANANAVYTTTITVESCSNDATCTGYISTIVMTQTDIAQPTVTPFPYTSTPHSGSGPGGNHNASASASAAAFSGHVWPQSSQAGGMSTAVVSPTRSAVNPLYTGSASAGSRWSMVRVLGMMVAVVVVMVV